MVLVDKLMTIGAFAQRTGLSISAIRFYADQQVLVPAEVDQSSGYRRYAEEQVPDGILVRELRRLDMPLADIALALTWSDSERTELVEQHRLRLEVIVERAHALARTLGGTTTNQETAMNSDSPAPSTATATVATVPARDIGLALGQVLPAAATDPELPHLMGVLIEAKNGSVRMVATDRHRLAVRDLVPSTIEGDFAVVAAAATLAQWVDRLDGPGSATIGVDGPNLLVSSEERTLTAPVMPVAFPDYEQFLAPTAGSTSIRLRAERLLAAIPDPGGDHEVVLSTSGGGLQVTHDGGTVAIDAVIDGADRQVVLNAGFVGDAVRAGIGSELVIEVEDSLSPVLLRSADDGTFTTRIMPIKVD